MPLNINTLQTFVNQQIDIDQSARNKNGSIEANHPPKGRFNGLAVQHGVAQSESNFSKEVLRHVKNTSLNNQEVSQLLKNVKNFDLGQGNRSGEVIFKGLKGAQLSLGDAQILLNAAARHQSQAPELPPREAPAVPHRGTKPQIQQHTLPPLSPKITLSHLNQNETINQQLQTLIDKEVGSDITALTSRPSVKLDSLAIWPSASTPGAYGINLPGVGFTKSNSLQEAQTKITEFKHTQFGNEVKGRWGNEVATLNSKPDSSSNQAAIWKSESKPGTFGVHIPNAGTFRVSDLNQAQAKFSQHGIEERIATGENITVNRTNLPPAEIARLEQTYGVNIQPISIDGKEIAYLFGSVNRQQGDNHSVLFSSHGGARGEHKTFQKPEGLELKFASTTNNTLVSRTMGFAEKLKDGHVELKEDSQIYASFSRQATDYKLSGGIGTQPEQAAQFIGEMNRGESVESFDFLLLNREAKGVHFSDVIQALKDTCGPSVQDQLICHFCRPKDDDAGKFNVRNNYTG